MLKNNQIIESRIDVNKKWYFGNNRSKNLRIAKLSWNAPFFLTTSYEYAEEYSDYGVYKIELSNEKNLNILDFNNNAEVNKLKWPKILIDKIQDGKNDLNSIAYDMYILAFGTQNELMYIQHTDAWQKAAQYFKEKSKGIFKNIQHGASTWGDENDHQFLLQMWKDIYDAGFDGFMHIEFGSKVLALFDLKCIDKISVNPISMALNEKQKNRALKKAFKAKGQAAFPKIKSDNDIVFVSGIPKDKALQLLKRACHDVSNFHPEYMEKAVKWSDDQIFGVFNTHDKRNVLAIASVSYNGDESGAAYLHEMTGFIKRGYGKKLVIWLLQKFKKVYGQIALEGSGTKDDPYRPNEKLRDKFYATIPGVKIYRVENSVWNCPADFFYYGISDESIKEFLEKTYSNKKHNAIDESENFCQIMYRFIIGNIGVYEAAKEFIFGRFDANEAKRKWSKVLAASSWLPKPDFQYSKEYESWFTLAGKNLFEKTVLCVLRSLGIDNIELCESFVDDSRIVYSDIYQVIVKSDKINENDKNDVNDIKSMFDEIVSQYNALFRFDLSYMKFKVDSQPVYNNGEPCYEYDEDECAGDWTSLGWIRLNPNMKSVMDRYGVAWHGSDDIDEFTKIIIAHELAHEIWNNIADDEFKEAILDEAKQQDFNTIYLKTVKPSKLDEETFCEYLAHQIVQPKKDISFPDEEIADLSNQNHIVTHRVSDDANRFNVDDIVIAPWGTSYKVTNKTIVDKVEDSPYANDLTPQQLAFLDDFDEIAVLELDAQYEPPYDLEQIKAKYPEHIYSKLANDPVHRWRAETGIELIHREPTEEELDRIWKNWQLMSQEMKDISDKKSIEMFGCTNAEHYAQLKNN